jgi:hypothetical protein
MDKDDQEFEETLKNIFDHKIVSSTTGRTRKDQFLGIDQGGINMCNIVCVALVSDNSRKGLHTTEETWVIEWDHPDEVYKYEDVTILLDIQDVCVPF